MSVLRTSVFSVVLLGTFCCAEADSDALADKVVATVGNHEITVEGLRQFREESTASYRDPLEGLDAWRFYLQTMIDMELMLTEALDQGLDKTQAFSDQWHKDRRQRLIDEYSTRNIVRDLDLSVDDMRQRFIESKWNKVLRLAHIRTDTEGAANRVLRDLEQGGDFGEIAREVSTVPTTAAGGGLLEPWFGRTNLEEYGLTLEIGEELFDLALGDVSQAHQVGDSFEIFKIVDEGPAPEHYRAAFMRADYWREFQARWGNLVERLRAQMNAQVEGDAVAFLVERMAGSDGKGFLLGPEEQQMVLCRGDGFELTVLDFTETYNALWFIRSISFDSTSIAQFVERDVMPRALVFQAALNEGLDEDPVIVEWLEDKTDALLLEALQQKQVVERVHVDSAEIRQYYDTHTNLFMVPEEIQVEEILLANESEAKELMHQIQGGADMMSLAFLNSIRKDMDRDHGHLHMHNHPSERRVYGRLYDEVLEAPLGELVGPVELDEGFSIFRVNERVPPQRAPFEDAASRAEWWLKKQQETQLFDAMFVELREKYASRIEVFDTSLRELATD